MEAVLVAVVGGLLGLSGLLWQRMTERQDVARRHREELYGRLLRATLTFKASGNVAPLFVESQSAWLYASDDVLRTLGAYVTEIKTQWEQGKVDPPSVQAVETELVAAIRADLRATKANSDWVKERWPIDVVPAEEAVVAYLSEEYGSTD